MDRLNFILSKINQHLEEIEKRSKKDVYTNIDMYDALAMSCMQLVNRLIDLGKLVISEKHLGFPETYSDIFKILAQNGLITKEDLKLAMKLIYYRNLISHEYSTITAKELLGFKEYKSQIMSMVERLKTCFS